MAWAVHPLAAQHVVLLFRFYSESTFAFQGPPGPIGIQGPVGQPGPHVCLKQQQRKTEFLT